MRALAVAATLVALSAVAACTPSSVGPSKPHRTRPPARSHTHSTAPIQHPGTGVPASQIFVVAPPLSHPIPAKPLRTGQVAGYSIKVWDRATTQRCAVGNKTVGLTSGLAVQAYLRRHPCVSLARLLGTSRAAGRPVGFAENTMRMRDAHAAAGLRAELHYPDDLLSLNYAGYGLPSGPQSPPDESAFVASARGDTVTTFAAWYLDDPTPAHEPTLIRFARRVHARV